MLPFRKILFPVDFSEGCVAMVPYVKEMAQRFNATVTVLNAFNLVPDYIHEPLFVEDATDSKSIAVPYTSVLQELRQQREKRLAEFARTQLPGVNQTPRVEDGDPAAVIEWVARHETTDLITMSTRGFGKFRRYLLGSVTAKVLHDLSCLVLTSAHEPEPALASSRGYRSILCAVDLNFEADAVLQAAGRLAQVYQAKICLLNIEPSTHEYSRPPFDELLRHFEKTSDVGSWNLDTRVRILAAPVPEGIRRTAIEEAADLVVVGRGHQQGLVSRLWSHLYTIVRESPCPVLSV